MKFVQAKTQYIGGIDLHAENSYICIMDRSGKIYVHCEIPSNKFDLLESFTPYTPNITICCESTFNWYWVADLCRICQVEFVLGHALYLRLIHGAKKKNDRIDAKKLADLLRTGYFPPAYAYPQQMRSARDMLRARRYLIESRTAQYSRIKMLLHQQGEGSFPKNIVARVTDRFEQIKKRLKDSNTWFIAESALRCIERYDEEILILEKDILRAVDEHDPKSIRLLRTIPGCGTVLSLTILYEMHAWQRFKTAARFSSYARVVKVEHESAGKQSGGNNKIGNPTLQWAFGQVVMCAIVHSQIIKKLYEKLKKRHGAAHAFARLAHKFAVTAFYMLKNGESFDMDRFIVKHARPTPAEKRQPLQRLAPSHFF